MSLMLYYSKGTNTREMNHCLTFMLYLDCGHIVIKSYKSIQYVYFGIDLFLPHAITIIVQSRGLLPTQKPEWLSDRIVLLLSKSVSYNLNGVFDSYALYSFFFSFTLIFKMNLNACRDAVTAVSYSHTHTHTLTQRTITGTNPFNCITHPNSKQNLQRDESVVMYISNRAYLSTT